MRNLYRAFFPFSRGHVLLSRRLQPFSSWHLLQLEFAKSPLVGFPGEVTAGDLAVAAAACSTVFPYRFEQPTGIRAIWNHFRAVRRARTAAGLTCELAAWAAYRADHAARPEMFNRTDAKFCNSPAPLATWASLKLRGFSEAEAWNMPIGKACWYKVGLAEAEGSEVRFMTDLARAEMIQAGYGFLFEEAA